MPLSLSDYLHIDKATFDKTGCFDTILDADSLSFINFMRLRDAQTDELTGSYGRVEKLFDQVGILLKASKREADRFYREAFDLLRMAELEELCLGYSVKGTSGLGSGGKLKQKILPTGRKSLIPVFKSQRFLN